ncbi:MAG: M67 family metallopeptidase [Chloroflexota bacterium]|nr:M67 family metallopeptidase [Chloroflexota bacterium]
MLFLGEDLWKSVLAHLEACLPNEGVGLLSTVDASEMIQAVRFYPGTNLNESPSRFTMDPLDVLRACEDMEREGTRLGVVVHSHPTTDPEPSQTDVRELALPGVINLIVQLRPRVRARAWEITSVGSIELPIHAEATVPGEG